MLTGLFNTNFRGEFHLQWSFLFKDYKIHLTFLFKTFQDGNNPIFFANFTRLSQTLTNHMGKTELTSHKPLQEKREAFGILGL